LLRSERCFELLIILCYNLVSLITHIQATILKKILFLGGGGRMDKKVQNLEKTKKTKTEDKFTPSISLQDLLEAGCHFGHTVSKTHPKIKPYLYLSRDGGQIFDLIKTKELLEKACQFLYRLSKEGKPIVFVGTKKQAKAIIEKTARESGAWAVFERWLGGTLTNWPEIQKRLKVLAKLKEEWEKGVYSKRPKKEQSQVKKEINRLGKLFGGLEGLTRLPAALVIVDVKKEMTAVKEALKEKVALVAITDSNVDPTLVDYPVPANDDALKSINLLITEMGRAVKKGYAEARKNGQDKS